MVGARARRRLGASRADRAELAREALDELRDAVGELRPPDLEQRRPRPPCSASTSRCCAARGARASTSRSTSVRGRLEPRPRLLRIAQEALHNALRHAAATARIRAATRRRRSLVLEVADDGEGSSRRAQLRTPAARADVDGGTAPRASAGGSTIESAPERRTTVRWRCRLAVEQIRELLVDDHAVVREGLRTFLALQDGMEIAARPPTGATRSTAVARLAPDIVLMDS